uniref:MRG domain-containing protein n=1 Tax=Ditylenchus dipsaci TaxID=166011 RepID=A0A915DK44_9BILA
MKRSSKSNARDGNKIKKSDLERDTTTERIQHDPVWRVGEKILCDWKGCGVFYEAEIITVKQYDDEPVYVVAYPGYKHGNEQVLQVEAFTRFLPITDENLRKAKAIIESAKKKAKEVRQSKGSGGRSVANSSRVSSRSTPQSDPKSADLLDSIHEEEEPESKRTKLSLQSDTNGDITEAVKESEPERPKLSLQSAVNTSEDSVVPATPDSELPEGTVATAATGFGMLPKKLKEISEFDRQAVEIEYKLPNVPARISVTTIINGYIGFLKGSDVENFDQEQSVEANADMSTVVHDKSLVNSAILVAEELLKCFDKPTIEQLLYYYEKPFFQKLCESSLDMVTKQDDVKQDDGEAVGMCHYRKHAKGSEAINVAEIPSLIGIPFLLRLIENFEDVLLEKNKWALTDTNSIVSLSHFINYLADRSGEFFSEYDDYHSPSPQYFEKIFAK